MRPQDAWLATLGQFQLQLHRATYDTWLRDCKFVAYENGIFTLSVRNAYAKDWLEQRLYRSIRHTLSGIFQQPVEINFVVSNPNHPRFFDSAEDGELPLLAGTDDLAGKRPLPSTQHPRAFHSLPGSAPNIDPSPVDKWKSQLNLNYTFETFVVGPNNHMAHAAAQAVASNPAQAYNPLFLYGDVGLGKTHLLQAIGNACMRRSLKVLYTTSEQFMNKLVESIRNKTTADFRDYYRCVDVLLVDDVQFLAGKDSTQEEFFHTFNALREQGKQIALASDRRPHKIKDLDERLRSRFEWGLPVEILCPPYETRLAILTEKSQMQGHHLPIEVAHLIASRCQGNIRDLEGVLTQVLAYTTLLNNRLTVDIAERILTEKQGLRRDQTAIKRQVNLEEVLVATATYYQLSLDDLLGKRRTREVAYARQLAIYLAREETQASWPEIGGALGGRNHSTMVHSYKKIAEEIENNAELRRELDDIRQKLYSNAV